MEGTKKEIFWKELKGLKKGQRLNMVQISRNAECSLAYISSLSRYAYESDFLEFDESGNYSIKNIPEYNIFRDETNKIYAKYRTKRNPTRTRAGKPKIPENFVVNEDTVLTVISAIIQKNKDLEEKIKKLKQYAKKVKTERDELLEGVAEI